jgi:hypothetical protein
MSVQNIAKQTERNETIQAIGVSGMMQSSG